MRLVIDPSKLSSYLLDVRHPVGGPKARFFLGRGFSLDRPERLAEVLAIHTMRATLVRRSPHDQGHKLVYECAMQAADGSSPCIRSVWIATHDNTSCRLITAYPIG